MNSVNNNFNQQLREAAPYFKQLRASKILLLLSPSQLQQQSTIFSDLVLLRAQGAQLLVVLDTRAEVNAELGRDAFSGAASVLSADDLRHCKRVVDDCLRLLVSGLQRALAAGHEHRDSAWLIGSFAYARNRGVIDGVDTQYHGQVRNVNSELIDKFSEHILLFGQVLPSQSGEYYLVNSLEIFTSLAQGIDKTIILGAVPEPCRSCAWQPSECLQQLPDISSAATREQLALLSNLCSRGRSKRGYLLDASADGSILQELLTTSGAGIMVTAEHYEQLRSARVEDINQLLGLIDPMIASGKLRPRDATVIEAEIDGFMVAARDFDLVGCVALRPWSHQPGWVELECLAVSESARGSGLGRRLLQFASKRARAAGYSTLVILTTQSMGWFAEQGFKASDGAGIDLDRIDRRCRGAQIMLKQLNRE